MRCIEDICVFYKQMPCYNPQGLVELEKPRKRKKNCTAHDTVYKMSTLNKPHDQKYTNYPRHLLEFANEAVSNRNRYHPTQKPVKLLEYLIKTYTEPGAVVLDNCMGSGSTGVAAANTGRKFIGIELEEKYFNIAKQRINDAAFIFAN